jgi:hypothetical protein
VFKLSAFVTDPRKDSTAFPEARHTQIFLEALLGMDEFEIDFFFKGELVDYLGEMQINGVLF